MQLPHLAPAYSPRKAQQSQCDCIKAHSRRESAPTQPRRSVRRVQRVEDSLAQVWGAQPQRTPRGKNFKTNMTTQKGTKAAPPAPSPVLRTPVTRRDRHKKTRKPEVNPQRQITPKRHENARMAISTLRNRNGAHRKPSLFHNVKKTGVNRRQNTATEPQGRA